MVHPSMLKFHQILHEICVKESEKNQDVRRQNKSAK